MNIVEPDLVKEKQVLVNTQRLVSKKVTYFRSSRKTCLLITIFATHSSFLRPSFFKEDREKGKIITKVVVKRHAFLLDPYFQKMYLKLFVTLMPLCCSANFVKMKQKVSSFVFSIGWKTC